MIRNTLTIPSLISLLLSLGPQGASYWEPRYRADESSLPHYYWRENIKLP